MSTISQFLSPKQQQIASEAMRYVASIYSSHNLHVLFGWPLEDLLSVIEIWPHPEDDVRGFWIMDGAVGVAFSGAPPHPNYRDEWFTFSPQENRDFMNYRLSLRPHYRVLVERRRELEET